MTTTTATGLYVIEAWKGLECVGWQSGCQARTVQKRTDHYVLDRDADRVYVRRGGDVVATWTATGGWRQVADSLTDHLRP